jgi:hypothetical protein
MIAPRSVALIKALIERMRIHMKKYGLLSIFFASFTVHGMLAATTAAPISLAQYTEQKAQLAQQSTGIKKKLEEKQSSAAAQIPPLDLPENSAGLSVEQQNNLNLFITTFSEAHGPDIAQQIMRILKQDPQRLRVCIALAQTQGKDLKKIVKNKSFIQLLLQNPAKLLAAKRPYRKPLIQSTITTMSMLKKYMSPYQWGAVMREFIGSLFVKFWSSIWSLVRDALVLAIGAEKIYEVDKYGTIKRDSNNQKLPRLIPQYSVNENGEAEKKMIPTKWYGILEDQQSILGQIMLSGIDQSVTSTLQSLDRLFLRPIASKTLNIPRWKLSHLHYRLAMTEMRNPTNQIITPRKLAEYIERSPQKFQLVTSGLPFNLRTILGTKDTETRQKMLQVAITKHLWQIYEPIWAELQGSIQKAVPGANPPTEDALRNLTAMPDPGKKTRAAAAKSFADDVISEALEVGRDSLKGKLQQGPLGMYMLYVNLALNIPHAILSFDNQEKPETELNLKTQDGRVIPASDIIKAVEICEALARYERRVNTESFKDYTKIQPRSITITHPGDTTPTTYQFKVAPITLTRLLEAQERGLKKYLPFMNDIIQDSYEEYIMKLVMPRLIFTLTPEVVKDQLGIRTIADAASAITLFKRHYNITFDAFVMISQMLAMIAKFEGKTSLAGHYVEVADIIDNFLISISRLIASVHPTQRDDWELRLGQFVGLGSTNFGREINNIKASFKWIYEIEDWSNLLAKKDPFSVTQQQKMYTAIRKSRYPNPLLITNRTDILSFLNTTDANQMTALRERLFTQKSNQETLAYALRIQKENKTLPEYQGKVLMSFNELTQLIREWYEGKHTAEIRPPVANAAPAGAPAVPQPAAAPARSPAIVKEVTERAMEIILHTFGLLSSNTQNKQEDFFTAATQKTVRADTTLEQELKRFKSNINDPLLQSIAHVQKGLGAIHTLYSNYGLKEITAALDAHYYATGKRLNDIPPKLLARIAAKESMAHLVGRGADYLLNRAILTPLLGKINQLQENGLMMAPGLDQMVQQQLSMFIGGAGGRTNAYHAARSIIRNTFDYGSTALSGSSLTSTVTSKFTPASLGGLPGVAEHQELMLHAKMIAKSGRTPTPEIAARLKRAGIDPNNLPKEEFEDDEEFDEEDGGQDEAPELSPALNTLFQEANAIAQKEGPEAARTYLSEQVKKLSAEDKAILKKHGFEG